VILHPGVLALLLGAFLSLALLATGAVLGLRIAQSWHPERADEQQLLLERRSWLVATLVQWAVAFETLSLLLFLYTVDDLHPLFVGAMCATGTLNANPVGWHLLWIKLLLFLLGSLWWVANRLDQQVPAAPLTRPKYLALLVLLPLCTADLVVMTVYFAGLQPEIITSCCGSLFSTSGYGVAAELAALPMRPMIIAFYLGAVLYGGMLLICRWRSGAGWRTLLAVTATGFGAVTLASVVAFISVYYYRLPSHHCPFDLLQGHYHLIGYPLYLCLFGALLCGLVPQLLVLLRAFPDFSGRLAPVERRWLNAGLLLLLGLLALVSWPLLFGAFTMKAYL
jgi:hypothetical protein